MEEVFDIGKVMNLLKRNWKFIVSLSIIGALIAALISFFLIKPTYSASTQILVNNKKTDNQFELQANQTDLQLINTYNEIIKSPVILEKVARNLKLKNNLDSKISVNNATQSKVITITAESGNYSDAVKIVNEIAFVFSNEIGKIMKTDNVTILSKADEKLNVSPINPKPVPNIFLGIIAGAVFAFILKIIFNILDKRVTTEEEVKESLGIPVIGMIPHFDEKSL